MQTSHGIRKQAAPAFEFFYAFIVSKRMNECELFESCLCARHTNNSEYYELFECLVLNSKSSNKYGNIGSAKQRGGYNIYDKT